MPDPLDAVSPLDGRYAEQTAPLRAYASEGALMRERARVEVEYLIALADLDDADLELDGDERRSLRSLVGSFSADDARQIKRIEREGTADRPPTNHDVKAVEYWLRDALAERDRGDAVPWVHFGLTSEDVNNLAHRLLVRGAYREVLRPEVAALAEALASAAREHRDVAMPARTHGQPASPTTYGKELAVFAARLNRGLERNDRAVEGLAGKFGGATGTFAAHHTAMPDVDWPAVAGRFVGGFDLIHLPLTTQINPNDDLARLFDALAGIATVLVDLDRDMWRYVSDGYLRHASESGEVGSSTMPHKVNPIDFENAEGNLERARNDLRFLADTLATSRLQRDLSDSTVTRNVGSAIAHLHLGVTKTAAGLEAVEPDPGRMEAALAAEPAVLAEAVQTALRRIGDPEAYERVKAATRGERIDSSTFEPLIERIEAVDPALAERVAALTPSTYTGLASALVDALDDT